MTLRAAAKVVGVNLLVAAICLVLIEVVFGDWFGPARLIHLNVLKDVDLRYSAKDLYPPFDQEIHYRRDVYGLRGAYRDPATIDVLTIGGSTTDQRYVSEGSTWQDVMADEFRREGRRVSVVNAGVDGQSTVGHIKDFELWFPQIPDLKPRFVLLYVGLNDFNVREAAPYDAVRRIAGEPPMLDRVLSRSALHYLFRTAAGVLRARTYKAGHSGTDWGRVRWTSTPLQSGYEGLMSEHLDEYGGRLRTVAEKVRELGARAIFVTQTRRSYKRDVQGAIAGVESTQPYDGVPINGVDQYHMMSLLNGRTLEICGEVRGICVDLASELLFEDEDFYNFDHNTPRGARKIGEYLHRRLSPFL